MLRLRKELAQGQAADASGGVDGRSCTALAPGLPSSSSMRESLRQAPGRDRLGGDPAGVSQLRNGCYHTGSVNVL